MRHARLTWPGALHHVMNRGLNGENIFEGDDFKSAYLAFLGEESQRYKIRIFSFTIMTNHFHIILENATGKLSEFMKALNGKYAKFYRKEIGGRGYVFHDRFKSTLIQDESYLRTAILYTILNPVRAKIVELAEQYKWSSLQFYFNESAEKEYNFLDKTFVEELFGSGAHLLSVLGTGKDLKLEEKNCKFGRVMGSEEFIKEAKEKYDRRMPNQVDLNKRFEDRYFQPAEKVLMEFKSIIGKNINEIDTHTYEGKRQRGELLVYLKDLAGLKYYEIVELEYGLFTDVSLNSLSKLYGNAKKRMQIKRK